LLQAYIKQFALVVFKTAKHTVTIAILWI